MQNLTSNGEASIAQIDLRAALANHISQTVKGLEYYQSKLEHVGEDCDPAEMISGALAVLQGSTKNIADLLVGMAFANS